MEIEEIKKQIEKSMIEGIESVLSGEKSNVMLHYVRPAEVLSYIRKMHSLFKRDIDTNGWEWDYWIDLTIDDKKYMLSGDGYYHDHATFELITE